jgi:hypothetical protein
MGTNTARMATAILVALILLVIVFYSASPTPVSRGRTANLHGGAEGVDTPSTGVPGVKSEKPPIDVRSYGAVPGDGGDDLSAINAAIDAVAAAGGGIVYLPQGQWDVSHQVVLKSHVSLVGDGWSTVIKALPDSNAPVVGTKPHYGFYRYDIAIRHLSIDGNGDNVVIANGHSEDQSNIVIDQTDGFVIEDVNSFGSPFNGVYVFNSSKNGRILDSRFCNNGISSVSSGRRGIALGVSPRNIRVDNCVCDNNLQHGISVQNEGGADANNITFTGCTANHNGSIGIFVGDNQISSIVADHIRTTDVCFRRCTVSNNSTVGVKISFTGVNNAQGKHCIGERIALDDCDIGGNGHQGILVQASPDAEVRNVQITGGSVHNCGYSAVFIASATVSGSVISGLRLWDNGEAIVDCGTDSLIFAH